MSSHAAEARVETPSEGPRCSRPRCGLALYRDGLCRTHYRCQPDRGYVDADIVRERLDALHQAGMAWSQIAAAAGLTERGLSYLRSSACRTRVRTARNIFGVQARAGIGDVDASGSRRRVQALMLNGWPCREIAQRTGISAVQVYRIARNAPKVTAPTRTAIAAVFVQLWDQPGPCDGTRERARSQGWAPAAAWDDIDDPAEVPDRGSGGRPGFAERYLELLWLGERNSERLAQRLGVSEDSMRDMCSRGGLRRVS